MKIKNIFIRNWTLGHPGITTTFKRIFNFLVTSVYFALISILLFKIDEIDIQLIKKYSLISLLIFLCLSASKMSNNNVNISFANRYLSQFMSLLVLLYVTLVVIFFKDHEINQWWDLMDFIYVIIPLMVIHALWKVGLSLTERKVRPFFALEQLYIAIISILSLVTISITKRFVEHIIDNGLSDLLSNAYSLFYIIFVSTSLSLIFFCIIKKNKFRKINSINREVSSISSLHTAVLKIGPVTVWFLYMFSPIKMSESEILFLVLAIFILLAPLPVLFSKNKMRNSSSAKTMIFSTMIFSLLIVSFVLYKWFELPLVSMFSIMLPSILFVSILTAIMEPRQSIWYRFAYNSFMVSLSCAAIILWSVGSFMEVKVGFMYNLLGDLLLIPILFSSVYMEAIIIFSLWRSFRVINRNARRIIKINKKQLKG